MKPHCCLDNPSIPLVIDASVAINLNATGYTEEILRALPHEIFIGEAVVEELTDGRHGERADRRMTMDLIRADLLKIARLGDVGLRHFENLVTGNAEQTVDDGEATTIAFAMEAEAIATLDERKATRISAERFPDLRVAATVDLLAHTHVLHKLGQETLVEAVLNALHKARMSVQNHHLEWVVKLIGPDRADECRSLPRSVRSRRC